MVMMLGIDPGLSGALALLDTDGGLVKVWDVPTMARSSGKGNEINGYILADIFSEVKEIGLAMGHKIEVMIEAVGPMPTDSRPAAFKFGETCGVLRGVICANFLTLHFTRPQQWKKYQGLIKKDKNASRSLAMQKWPESRDQFARVKDADRAEAALVADFGRSRAGWKVET